MELKNVRKCLRIKNGIIREMLAECVGTFILVTFAIGTGAQYVLSRKEYSSYLTVNAGAGIGVTLGIYWAGGVSGGYLNPSVTLVFCLRGNTPWWKYPYYVFAQHIGAFIAAAGQFGVYYDALYNYDGGVRTTEGPNATAGIFATYPQPNVSTLNCYFDQVFSTFILTGCILAITDHKNWLPSKGLLPLALGSIMFGIGTCWAYNCGYPINPARDFGPRLFTMVAGWGLEPISFRNYNWFWVPIAGPLSGGLLAWVVYMLSVELHWEPDDLDDIAATVAAGGPPEIIVCEKEPPTKFKESQQDNNAFLTENPVVLISHENTKT